MKIFTRVDIFWSARLRSSDIKPGSGWQCMSNPVYEHVSGVRVHVSGRLLWRKETGVIKLSEYEGEVLDLFIGANGGNKKRGIMAFARFVNGGQFENFYQLTQPTESVMGRGLEYV